MDQLSDSDVTVTVPVCGVKAQAQFAGKALCLRVSLCPYPHSDHELMEKKRLYIYLCESGGGDDKWIKKEVDLDQACVGKLISGL